ncbi:MAG: cytidylate kinase-like family protein [Propionicimonas sp.]
MAVITISRQLGSHGARIARALARDLGWEFADKYTINRVIRQYGLTRLDDLYTKPPKLRELFDQNSHETIQMMNETIAAIAARGNVVILGRGGFVVLKDFADVLHAFVEAPSEVRVARVAKRDNLQEVAALEKVLGDDKLRQKFMSLYYGADWAKPENFELVVNTESLSDEDAVAQIKAALTALPAPAEGAKLAANLAVDPVLAQTVDEVMATMRIS